jgi:hypothetical protein
MYYKIAGGNVMPGSDGTGPTAKGRAGEYSVFARVARANQFEKQR